ncbi:hypothetical protein [Maridesulfovibrio ferrireducens]|uniref:hypothetical protein n=1 Tax=Maridesulfovibrio ferrireducens TaxID=246191 RepID=UPI001A2BFD15|nr:hypothetical protein [Maridesulfovibrio ferrireducens]MBI9112731.1 hypothetical protein [Maridesulfovibrio ferrireducens]
MISKLWRTAILILAVATMAAGCSSRNLQFHDPDKVYSKFRNEFGTCNATGVNFTASLYYTAQKQGHRTIMNLWGDLGSPLRLDVRAGIGTYLAHILEDKNGLTAFYPDQNTAYSHSSPERAVRMLGLPFPFSLKDLAGLIAGCYPDFIPSSFDTVTLDKNRKGLLYLYDKGPVSSITLTEQGIPTEITGRGELPWIMKMESYELNDSGKNLPDKITVYTENGNKAVLRIKSRSFTNRKWTEKSLEMAIPDGTETIKLDQNSNNNISSKNN